MGEAKEFAESLGKDNNLTYINGYDDPPIIAGAGTIGIELIDDVPEVDAVVVPIGGAGLIAGIACAVKTLKPDCKVSTLLMKLEILLLYRWRHLYFLNHHIALGHWCRTRILFLLHGGPESGETCTS